MASKECNIRILDEVNCQIFGLDFDTKNACSRSIRFFSTSAPYSLPYKMGRWDGYISYMDRFGNTYNNLLDRLVPIIEKAGYSISVDDSREKNVYEWDKVDNTYLSHIVFNGNPLILRDEQVEVINTCLKNPQCVIDAATGLGKTNITGVLVDKARKYGRSIVIVPNIDLVTQTASVLTNLGIDTGVYYGEEKQIDKDVTICTWQSLSSLYKDVKRGKGTIYKKFSQEEITQFLDNVKCVILDECLSGDTLIKTLDGYKKIKECVVGDKIFSYDVTMNDFVEDEIVKVHENLTVSDNEDMYKLTMENGEFLEITGNHKVLTQRGWKMVKVLELSDEIIDFE